MTHGPACFGDFGLFVAAAHSSDLLDWFHFNGLLSLHLCVWCRLRLGCRLDELSSSGMSSLNGIIWGVGVSLLYCWTYLLLCFKGF